MKRMSMETVFARHPTSGPVRYPVRYGLFVILAGLAAAFTRAILRAGGTEVNPVADGVFAHRGLPGMLLFKFGLVLLIIALCELIGRRRDRVGRRLAAACVMVTAIPVLAATAQLAAARLEGAVRSPATASVAMLNPAVWEQAFRAASRDVRIERVRATHPTWGTPPDPNRYKRLGGQVARRHSRPEAGLEVREIEQIGIVVPIDVDGFAARQ
ncbi:MAG: hypothetical protein GY778_29730 [bacterium]|nr:hypothetical protein [bacterium]